MGGIATDQVRAFISRGRIAEMKAHGWRIVGPGEEGSLLMEGPPLGGAPVGMAGLVDDLFERLVARALERADAAQRAAGAARAA